VATRSLLRSTVAQSLSWDCALHVQQMNLPADTSEEGAAVAENILRELPADKYPHLAEMMVEHASSLATTMRKSSSSGWISSSAAWTSCSSGTTSGSG
jgi:hypothetical protein